MSSAIRFHFLFEQSGTFKRCAQALGYTAFDYDILDMFGETDYKVDLFEQIESAYQGKPSMFDAMTPDDVVMAFFPCIRFSTQFSMILSGNASQLIGKAIEERLDVAMTAHDELNRYYRLLSQMVTVCVRKHLRLVVENPFTGNYLNRYFPIVNRIVYSDRRKYGDYYEKPTMFLFYGWQPHDNPVLECVNLPPKKYVEKENSVNRSMIAPGFARYFILSHLLPFAYVRRLLYGIEE